MGVRSHNHIRPGVDTRLRDLCLVRLRICLVLHAPMRIDRHIVAGLPRFLNYLHKSRGVIAAKQSRHCIFHLPVRRRDNPGYRDKSVFFPVDFDYLHLLCPLRGIARAAI